MSETLFLDKRQLQAATAASYDIPSVSFGCCCSIEACTDAVFGNILVVLHSVRYRRALGRLCPVLLGCWSMHPWPIAERRRMHRMTAS